jgi:hypothetical protein
MSSTTPSRITITPNEVITYTWDMTDLLADGETLDAVDATMTRLVALPELDVTDTALPFPPAVDGNLVSLQLDGTLLTVNSVYRIGITFMPNVDTTLEEQTFLYVRNASPYPTTGITLRELRQRCGTMLNDLILTEATYSNAADDLSSWTDTDTITLPTGELKNRIIYFYGGTAANIGQQRVISENFSAEGRLLWNTDLPSPPQRGDRAELWNHRAQGVRPLQMNDFIKIAHAEASVYNHTMLTIEISEDFTSTEPDNTVAIPSGVSKIERVQYMTNDRVWVDIAKATPGGPGYWIDTYNRTMTINRPISTWADGSIIRIMARGREYPLVNDDDTTIINAEWLCARSCELACTALVNRNPDQNVYRDKMYKYERIAQSMRTLIVPRTKAGTTLEW